MTQTMQQPTTPTTPTVPFPASNHIWPKQGGNRQETPHSSVSGTAGPHSNELEGCPFLVLILPPDEGEREAQAMENWFQSCASDEPFALELVGTRREQGFVLRASS